MAPRISSKEATAMYDAYQKVKTQKEEPKVEAEPKEEPVTEPEASTEE